MEPFALFNLLSSLLPKTQNEEQKTDLSSNPVNTPPTAQTEHPNEELEKKNPCLEFFDMHEQRVKRTKKS